MKQVVDAAQGLRERKKVRTREAIIDAALDLFERQGFDATTIEDIADAAEVSPRTFFRYFDSKVDLVMARHGAKGPGIGARLMARPESEGILDAMREVMRTELVEVVGEPSVLRELQVMLTSPTLRNLAREHLYEEEAELVGVVAGRLGIDESDLRAHVTAGVIASAAWIAVNRWIAEGADPDRLQPMLDHAFALLANGLRPGTG